MEGIDDKLVDALPLGVVVVRAESDDPASLRILRVNPAASAQSGEPLEGSVGALVADVLRASEAWAAAVHACAVAQREEVFERDHIPSGATFRVWVRPLGDRVVAVLHEDISELRRRDAAVRESERLNRSIVASLREGVLVADTDGIVRQVNDALGELCGAEVGDLVGRHAGRLPLAAVLTPAGEPLRFASSPLARALAGECVRDALFHVERRDGRTIWVEVNSSPLRDADTCRSTGAVSTYADVTERIERERRVRREAERDPLTGLANRRTLERGLGAAVDRARGDGHGVAVLLVDLDGFKAINDSFGHATGDDALREIARRLEGAVRERDLVARPGGDEFVLVCVDVAGAEGRAEELRERVVEALRHPLALGEHEVPLEAAVGLACFPDDAPDAQQLLEAADRAMYARKRER